MPDMIPPLPYSSATVDGKTVIVTPQRVLPKAQAAQQCARMCRQIDELDVQITALQAKRAAMQTRCDELQALHDAAEE